MTRKPGAKRETYGTVSSKHAVKPLRSAKSLRNRSRHELPPIEPVHLKKSTRRFSAGQGSLHRKFRRAELRSPNACCATIPPPSVKWFSPVCALSNLPGKIHPALLRRNMSPRYLDRGPFPRRVRLHP